MFVDIFLLSINQNISFSEVVILLTNFKIKMHAWKNKDKNKFAVNTLLYKLNYRRKYVYNHRLIRHQDITYWIPLYIWSVNQLLL